MIGHRRFWYCKASNLFVVIVCLDSLLFSCPWNKLLTLYSCHYTKATYFVVCVVYLPVKGVSKNISWNLLLVLIWDFRSRLYIGWKNKQLCTLMKCFVAIVAIYSHFKTVSEIIIHVDLIYLFSKNTQFYSTRSVDSIRC